jgi:hypothetical protein
MKPIWIQKGMIFLPAFLGMVLLPAVWAGSSKEQKIIFHLQPDASFTFDTGVLRGKLHAGGKSLGITEVIHLPSGKRLDREPGLLDLYRLFSGNRRFLPDVRDFPSTVRVLADGNAEVHWNAGPERPFELTAVYHWVDPSTVEMELSLRAHADLNAFEVFQSSYASAGFVSCRHYCRQGTGNQAKAGFQAADPSRGDWQMFPRSAAEVPLLQDGRWKNEPYPVEWIMQPEYALPLGIRSDPVSGLSLLLMTRPQDCLAISTPQEKDEHYSLYFSLFGGDIQKGSSRKAWVRMVVSSSLTDLKALNLCREFLAEKGAR